MSVGILERSILQYVLQYGFAILQYIAIRFLLYCCTPTNDLVSDMTWSIFNSGLDFMKKNILTKFHEGW